MQIKIPKFQDAHRGSIKEKIMSVSHPKNHVVIAIRYTGIPSGIQLTFVALAIGTRFVSIKLEQTLNDLLVLGGLSRGRTARHGSSSTQSGITTMLLLLCTRDGRLTGSEMRIVALWVAVRGGLVALSPWAG